ncbi:hypothetical protein Poly21_41920 [Allorhodopirellula heiligendammensis]|uniref:Uncharacterized protein n=1 Tax=Allorhodopirellula heiligendammensis TaxID=2714739 RepID=A0A5C6BXG6_9BACT|nr:hypothetical protein Poly21_41920 [Allorhodopirellula heiligendammensis]
MNALLQETADDLLTQHNNVKLCNVSFLENQGFKGRSRKSSAVVRGW